MSGPIIRSGPSSKYSNNWDQAFGGKKKAKKSSSKTKATKKAAKKKSAKKS